MIRVPSIAAAPVLLILLVILPGIQEEEKPSVRVMGDAWPRMPRIIGYAYRMKDRRQQPAEPVQGMDPFDLLPAGKGSYRLVGVEVTNPGMEPLKGTIASPQLGTGKRVDVEIPPGGVVRRYFPYRPKRRDKEITFQILGSGRSILGRESAPLPEKGRSGTRVEVSLIARELNTEEKIRERLRTHPVEVRVGDEHGRPVEGASLTLLHDETGHLVTAKTDEEGSWSGSVLPGSWIVIARKVFPPPKVDPNATALPPTRCLYMVGRWGIPEVSEIVMAPDFATPLWVEDEQGIPIGFERLWIAPREIADPMRFEDVARRCRDAFLLDVKREMGGGGVQFLGSPDVEYLFGAFIRPGGIPGAVLMRTSGITREPIHVKREPKKLARIRVDTKEAPGEPGEMDVWLSFPDSVRIEIALKAKGTLEMDVPPGSVRSRIRYDTPFGERMTLAPHRIVLKAGQKADLTPRFPLVFVPCYVQSEELQIWLGLRDPLGRVVEGLKAEGMVRAAYQGRVLFEGDLAGLRFQFPSGMKEVNVAQVDLAATLKFGGKTMVFEAKAREREKFQGEMAEVVAPACLGDHAAPLLEVIRKSLVGSDRVIGLPQGLKKVSNRYEVFLPPDVGGLGGGGAILLDLRDLLRYCSATDSLPWAFRHEFGHNLGFGHGPDMFLAPCGIDDEMFGRLGYRMMNGRLIARALAYLDRPRPDPESQWKPDGGVFTAIGLLYGPELHKRMFDVQRHHGRLLRRDLKLSHIECIAAQYTVAAGENMGWIFRAFGWPVMDERLLLGVVAIERRELVRGNRLPDEFQGMPIRTWWVQGPFQVKPEKKGKEEAIPPWRYLAWREDFIDLPDGVPEAPREVKYRLFHRIQAAQNLPALAVIASDVEVDLRVNGQSLGLVNGAPQMGQPRHDDYHLEEGMQSVIPIKLEKGENFIEIRAHQDPGSKGFYFQIAGYDGKDLGGLVRLRAAGPEDDGKRVKPKLLDPRLPIHNPSFEEGQKYPKPWIGGPMEPRGGIQWRADGKGAARGDRSLRIGLMRTARGAVIQRVLLEPGERYVLRGAVRTEGLRGKDSKAYICVFHQDPFDDHLAKTEYPAGGSPTWQIQETVFFPRKRRVAYVGCVVQGDAGTAWFDEVRLTKEK